MTTYILVIEQSTSATKGILFDETAKLIYHIARDHHQYYPKPGWVEHDPEEIYFNTRAVIRECIRHLIEIRGSSFRLASLSITNQRQTVVVWDKETGMPIAPAVVWQCNRGAEQCEVLRQKGWGERIKQKTGLIIDPYFSATGISWLLDNVRKARKKAEEGKLLFGTIDSWLIFKLTGGKVHATDFTNASRTMLFNINTLTWDEDILKEFGIPLSMAPEVKYSDEIFGHTKMGELLREEIPITGVMGDSHAALFGQRCFSKGEGKATYSTGTSVMLNIGDSPLESPDGLVTSVGYGLKHAMAYAYEGNIHSTGASIKWLQSQLKIIRTPEESEQLALSVDSTDGVYLVPAFGGLGAPYWNNDAKAVLCGMSLGTGIAHIARAALESTAYQIKDLVDLMVDKAGLELKALKVDGTAVKNSFLMQFQCDMLNACLIKNHTGEAAALGVALAGGLATGIWKDMAELKAIPIHEEKLCCSMSDDTRDALYAGWKKAVQRVLL